MKRVTQLSISVLISSCHCGCTVGKVSLSIASLIQKTKSKPTPVSRHIPLMSVLESWRAELNPQNPVVYQAIFSH